MFKTPINMEEFSKLNKWWRTEVPTEIVIAEDGVTTLFDKLADEKKEPFFIVDEILADQPFFKRIFEQKNKYLFNATASEPKTSDVDHLVAKIKSENIKPDVIVGIGGGSAMDLSKAVGICLANPEPAAHYQGYGLDMKRGTDIWVLPTLSGTGAEVTPIAVLRGPERKLGINNAYTIPSVAVISPVLSSGAKKINRTYTMLDCYFHHAEIIKSHTSDELCIMDSRDGCALAKDVLLHKLDEFDMALGIKSAMASVLGGSSSIGGRVGASHAISYGLSNCAPTLPHSVAVTISILALKDQYSDGAYDDTVAFLDTNGIKAPRARDYGIDQQHIDKMVKTALGMEKLWHSHFGDNWKDTVDDKFLRDIYKRIVAA